MKSKFYLIAAAGYLTSLGYASSANALNYSVSDGLKVYFDTTVTYGVSVRTAKQDPLNMGAYGNRIYDKWDLVANALRVSHDLEFQGDRWGALVRGNYFYDFEMANQDLVSAAENRLVKHGDITDAYVFKKLGSGDQLNLRLGKQVISWGESTFIGGSLNDINTVDITKLRTPGVELKDALVGTPAAYAQYSFNESVSLEAFWLAVFDEVKVDPSGSFFSTSDAIADGGGINPAPDGRSTRLGPLRRTADDLASKYDQWGIALRYFAPLLGNGFEFGFYYENLSDHLPSISTRVGSGTYFLEYPESIERYGVSFNTLIQDWAVSGEYSYRKDAPIQGINFVGAALGAVTAPRGSYFSGYENLDRHQIQVTGQRAMGPRWGADAYSFIGEVAYGWVDGKPSGGFVAQNPVTNDFWGYQLLFNATYNEALFGRVNLIPQIAFSHNVHGTSNEAAAVFVEDRKSITYSLNYNFNVVWKGSIGYTNVFGGEDLKNALGGRVHSGTDRDFLSADISFSF